MDDIDRRVSAIVLILPDCPIESTVLREAPVIDKREKGTSRRGRPLYVNRNLNLANARFEHNINIGRRFLGLRGIAEESDKDATPGERSLHFTPGVEESSRNRRIMPNPRGGADDAVRPRTGYL